LSKKCTSIQKSKSHKNILKSQAKEEATWICAQTHPTLSHEHVLFVFSSLNYIEFSNLISKLVFSICFIFKIFKLNFNLIYIFDLNYVPNLSYVFQFELYYVF
jgi:hypothetical protein